MWTKIFNLCYKFYLICVEKLKKLLKKIEELINALKKVMHYLYFLILLEKVSKNSI